MLKINKIGEKINLDPEFSDGNFLGKALSTILDYKNSFLYL